MVYIYIMTFMDTMRRVIYRVLLLARMEIVQKLTSPIQSWTQGTAPDAPSALYTSNVTVTSATLNWSAISGASNSVDYKARSSANWTNADTAITATSINVSGLTPSGAIATMAAALMLLHSLLLRLSRE